MTLFYWIGQCLAIGCFISAGYELGIKQYGGVVAPLAVGCWVQYLVLTRIS